MVHKPTQPKNRQARRRTRRQPVIDRPARPARPANLPKRRRQPVIERPAVQPRRARKVPSPSACQDLAPSTDDREEDRRPRRGQAQHDQDRQDRQEEHHEAQGATKRPRKRSGSEGIHLEPLEEKRKIKKATKYDVSPQNLLDDEHAPQTAPIARVRKPRVVKVGNKRRFPHGHDSATREPKVSLESRLTEFPGQGLVIRGDSLLCSLCSMKLSNRKGTLKTHLKSRRHSNSLALNSHRVQELALIEQTILDQDEDRVPGQSVNLEHRKFRLRVQRALMLDGIPPKQFHTGQLKKILEEQSNCMLPQDLLDSLTTTVFESEMKQLRQDLEGAPCISLTFDGCTEVSEVFAIVARYWNKGLKQRLVSLRWLRHSQTANEQASHIMRELVYALKVDIRTVVACVRDGAAVNTACVRKLRKDNPYLIDITCVSHTACLVGNKFAESLPTLALFSSKWSAMMNESNAARSLFRDLTQLEPKTKAKVKWFAEFAMCQQLLLCWPRVLQLIDNEGDFSASHRTVLRQLTIQRGVILEMELALFIDLCGPLNQLCCVAEGDGVTSPLVYDLLVQARDVLQSVFTNNPLTPNLRGVINYHCAKAPGSDFQPHTVMESLLTKAHPICAEFKHQFYDKHAAQVDIWKFCRIFSPEYVQRTEVDVLRQDLKLIMNPLSQHFPHLHRSLEAYKGHCVSFPQYPSILSFWVAKSDDLPDWFECLKFISLVQPFSAAPERVFSLLRNKFSSHQESTLEDYKACSVMMEFNRRSLYV